MSGNPDGAQAYAECHELLPEHIDKHDVAMLIEMVHLVLLSEPRIQANLEACNMQPTSAAFWLAAASAVNVLLAHEMGQGVARDEAFDEAEEKWEEPKS